MRRIEQITNDAKQKHTVILDNGNSFSFSLYYAELQRGWFITELEYLDLIIKGLRVTNSPNILHQYRNQIPFGLACFSNNEREPYFKQDFSSGASSLFILSQQEVAEYTGFLSGEI